MGRSRKSKAVAAAPTTASTSVVQHPHISNVLSGRERQQKINEAHLDLGKAAAQLKYGDKLMEELASKSKRLNYAFLLICDRVLWEVGPGRLGRRDCDA